MPDRPAAPSLGWSVSRVDLLDTCPRAYYYRYYLAWGGWDRNASEEQKEADLLKNLKNRWAWSGICVHDVIGDVLQAVRKGGWVRQEDAEDALSKRMREDWKASRRGDYRSNRKVPALVEHEYEESVGEYAWQRIYQNALTCLRNFYESPTLKLLRDLPEEKWRSVEELDKFQVEGVDIFVVLDLAYEAPDGRLVIVDWKTGKKRSPGYKMQLACYGFYARQKGWITDQGVDLDLVYLLKSETDNASWSDEVGQEAEKYIHTTLGRLRELHGSPEKSFPAKPSEDNCRFCTFQRLCEKRGIL